MLLSPASLRASLLGCAAICALGFSPGCADDPPKRGADNAARFAHARDLPQLLRDALPAPVRLTSVELSSARAVVVVPASGDASTPYARYEVRGGVVSPPSATSSAGVSAPDGGPLETFGLEDVDWNRIPEKARSVGSTAGIDVEMGIGSLTIHAAPAGGAVITGQVSASNPKGYDSFSIPAK